jgi:NTE family protein
LSKSIKLEYVAPEGSTVVFDALEFAINKNTDNKKSSDENMLKFESCDQRREDAIQVSNLTKGQNGRIYWFKAPYLRDENAVTSALNFMLKIVGEKTPYEVKVVVKIVQRAIIFQGGVALGAYEAGVLQSLVDKLDKQEGEQIKKGLKNNRRPLFDIIAGTSIGTMNAAIVASSVVKQGNSHDSQSWKNAVAGVMEFWDYQKYEWPTVADTLDMNPFYHFWWDNLHNTSKAFKRSTAELLDTSGAVFDAFYSSMNPSWKKWYDSVARYWFQVEPGFLKDYFLNGWYVPATAEAARRHYSAQQFGNWGTLNVATGIIPWSIFGKFLDFTDRSNSRPRVDNKHFVLFSLKETLGRLADFPIEIQESQEIREQQPRLLLVTVDVKTGDVVTFDSYSEKAKYHHHDKNSIVQNNGIEVEHALASGTFPNFFDYPRFKVNINKNVDEDDGDNSKCKMESSTNEEQHIFWDGGYRSNTPLREVIQLHRDYWHKIRQKRGEEDAEDDENDVPDLEVYIANLWPSELKEEEEPISYDLDFVENRKHDLLLSDRTDYDEKVADIVTDYVDLVKRLKSLAERYGASKEELDHVLGKKASSKSTEGVTRKYKELLGGRFRLTQVIRIDHKDDGNNVAGKIFDYSYKTIGKLIEEGNRDAKVQISMQSLKDQIRELASRHPIYYDKQNAAVIHIRELEECLNEIEESLKIGDRYDTVVDRITDFANKLESIDDEEEEENRLFLREEKILLIDVAKQFQETIINIQKR